MMSSRSQWLAKWRLALVAAVLGTVFGIAEAIGGHPGTGVKGGLFILAFWFVVSLGRGEVWTLTRGEGDERQRQIQAESAQITLMVVVAVALAGFLWEAAHGYYGKFGVMCSITGFTLLVVPLVLRRRR